jgi:Cellulase (glycosyl hydrolase family 5)
VVIMHGINMVYKRPPYDPAAIGFGNDDAAFLASIGFNAVRVGVIWKAVEPRPGVYDNAYLNRIAGTVRTLARHGIVSLLDFHQDMYNERFQGEGAPNWAVEDDGLPAVPKRGFPGNYLAMPALWHAFDHFWGNSAGPGGVGLQNRYGGRGGFRAGSITQIATPQLVYGGHYAAPVSGGAIVSRRGASTLSVAGCPGAEQIIVSIRPAGANHASCRVRAR